MKIRPSRARTEARRARSVFAHSNSKHEHVAHKLDLFLDLISSLNGKVLYFLSALIPLFCVTKPGTMVAGSDTLHTFHLRSIEVPLRRAEGGNFSAGHLRSNGSTRAALVDLLAPRMPRCAHAALTLLFIQVELGKGHLLQLDVHIVHFIVRIFAELQNDRRPTPYFADSQNLLFHLFNLFPIIKIII